MKNTLIFCIVLFIFFSCTSKESIQIIAQAENLLDTYPDSTLQILGNIKNPKSLSKKYYMKYTVLNVLAKYKNYKDINQDSVIIDAATYFDKNSDPTYTPLASYAAAAFMCEEAKYTGAMEYYKSAEKALENSDNYLLRGKVHENIAYLYDKQLMFDEALKHYALSLQFYEKLPDKRDLGRVFTSLGSDYLYVKKSDSALIYYNKAYDLSLKLKDINGQSSILGNLGLIYTEKGNNQQAGNYFKKAVNLPAIDTEQQYRNVLNLASNYLLLHKIDSASIYVPKVKESLSLVPVLSYQAAATNFLKNFYSTTGNYKMAVEVFEQNKLYHIQSFEENQSKVLLEAEKKFDYTVHKAEAEQAKLKQRAYTLFFIGVLLVIAIISIVIWNRYNKQRLYQKLETQQMQIRQHAQEIENQKLQNELGRFKYVNNAMYKVMEKANALHVEINDIVQAGILHEKSERYKKIQLRLKETQDTIKDNIAFNAESFLSERCLLEKNALNQLTEEEKIILTMLYYKESRKNIASLLSMSPQAVYNRIPRLKEKLISMELDEEKWAVFFEKQDLN